LALGSTKVTKQFEKRDVRFEVHTADVMESTIFWNITPHSPMKVNGRFRGTSQARNHEETGETGDIAPPFLNSVVDGGEWSASRLDGFTREERVLGTHWVGG
jgi:hypothetical protein